MMPPRRIDGAVVVVYASDRAWRTALDGALRESGLRTRLASRPAELAKSLTDGLARGIIAGPAAADHAAVAMLGPTCPVISASSSDTASDIVRQLLDQLDAAPRHPTPRQVTSSE